jgi:phosphatidylglycerophosphate synthase
VREDAVPSPRDEGETRRGFRAALNQLEGSQKPGDGEPAYLRWVNRPLGRRAAALAHTLGLTPDVVTWTSAAFSLAGFALIAAAPPTFATALGATLLLVIGYALDSADGQLARLTRTGSRAGEWLDHVVDAARIPMLHLAIACSFFFRSPDPHLWLVGAALAFAVVSSVWFFGSILASQLSGAAAKPVPRTAPAWVSFVKLPNDIGFLYLCLLTLPFLGLFAGLYLLLLLYTVMAATVSLQRKHRALRSG